MHPGPLEPLMPLRLNEFADVGLTRELLDVLLEEHERRSIPALRRLWEYYRNPREERGAGHACQLAQMAGLPARLRGMRDSGADDRGSALEVVIENDIGWRIDALVDFVFGVTPAIESTASDPALRRTIESAMNAMLEASGGVRLLQDAALLGSVHGWVDLLLDAGEVLSHGTRRGGVDEQAVIDTARRLRVVIVEAPRAVPLLDSGDYRRLNAFVIRSRQETTDVEREGWTRGMLDRLRGAEASCSRRRAVDVLEVWSARHRAVFVDGRKVVSEPNRMGVLPIVHVQNGAQPFAYSGTSDVEPLIPLQDELNTRLSDRAHRVTMQSFNMYLMKGLELSGRPTVGPGQVWSTDNPDASVQAFGGDAASPSEDKHIEQVREALDKTSGVSPVVLGIIRERLGHLSSENALRITLMGVINRTQRKRAAYGGGVERLCELALTALDVAGVLRTKPEERRVRLKWTDPLPVDETDRLRNAAMKRELGVPADVVLRELGYDPSTLNTNTTGV